MGGAGVGRALEILRNELDIGLALMGRASVRDLDRSALAWASQ
jgi:isopentenyl diphosphate isomerase/L-lactate dehydrogenase-like FMN-dependent dehydrogenase